MYIISRVERSCKEMAHGDEPMVVEVEESLETCIVVEPHVKEEGEGGWTTR